MTTILEQISSLIGENSFAEIYYHDCKSKNEAIKKVLETDICTAFDVGFGSFSGSKWAFAEKGNIRVTAFYED